MLILAAAIAVREGKADFARRHWPVLTQWAGYLEAHGFDPEDQLCTDDFAGHLAHNTNLSVKAILGLASYGRLAGMQGDAAAEKKYLALAKDLAKKWTRQAADGDHFSLTFDRKGTWSQKYNLVWDKLLGLNVFPPEVARKEIAFYLTPPERLRPAAGLAQVVHQVGLDPLDGDPGRDAARFFSGSSSRSTVT